jgi:hypothetical protein
MSSSDDDSSEERRAEAEMNALLGASTAQAIAKGTAEETPDFEATVKLTEERVDGELVSFDSILEAGPDFSDVAQLAEKSRSKKKSKKQGKIEVSAPKASSPAASPASPALPDGACPKCARELKPSQAFISALGTKWHETCLTCDECSTPLAGAGATSKLFAVGDRPFCELHVKGATSKMLNVKDYKEASRKRNKAEEKSKKYINR